MLSWTIFLEVFVWIKSTSCKRSSSVQPNRHFNVLFDPVTQRPNNIFKVDIPRLNQMLHVLPSKCFPVLSFSYDTWNGLDVLENMDPRLDIQWRDL